MHNRMQEQSSDFNQGRQPSAKPETKKKPDDYIDFEEVK